MGFYGNYTAWDFPFYSLYDISKFLRIPYSTVYGWIRGGENSILSASEEDGSLNFWDLTSIFVIRYMRDEMDIPLHRMRNASRCLRTRGPKKYSLIQKKVLIGENELMKEIRDVILQDRGKKKEDFNTLIGQCVDRIEFGKNDLPEALYPLGLNEDKKSIRIDPRVRFGQPVISGTGIPITCVQDRIRAGEKPEDIAVDYRIHKSQVADALAYANT